MRFVWCSPICNRRLKWSVPIEMSRGEHVWSCQIRVCKHSMNAQITHLMMSLVDDETRPGDPALFYRSWNRQGAYITAAPARAGDPKVGRVLSQFLVTHDFAGGAGPEADAPGLAIWALTESAGYIADKVHDEWLWPLLLRKVGRIEQMMTARSPIMEPYTVPAPRDFRHLLQTRTAVLAQSARDGVIVGRVGEDWPLLYVNAVSYRRLLTVADFAERLNIRLGPAFPAGTKLEVTQKPPVR